MLSKKGVDQLPFFLIGCVYIMIVISTSVILKRKSTAASFPYCVAIIRAVLPPCVFFLMSNPWLNNRDIVGTSPQTTAA